MEKIDQRGIQVLSFSSSAYPHLLKECEDAPILLFVRGKIPKDTFELSIVGTRTPSEYGKISTQQIIQACEGQDISIVSGLALGVDTIAHQTSIHYKLPTVAILAHGFDYTYPMQNRYLVEEIIDHGGGLITEYPPTTKIERHHFAARNRIIAGISPIIIVVESGEKGGSLRTAQFALQYNRQVLAVPGRWIDYKSLGVNQLIYDQTAEILLNPASIINYIPSSKGKLKTARAIPALDERDQYVLRAFSVESILHFDQILSGVEMSIADLNLQLIQLELKQLLQSLPGKFYRIRLENLVGVE